MCDVHCAKKVLKAEVMTFNISIQSYQMNSKHILGYRYSPEIQKGLIISWVDYKKKSESIRTEDWHWKGNLMK